MPDICVTTQKKLSLAWDTTAEPAPMAMTTSALSRSLTKPNSFIKGASMEAVVINATVDEPCAVLMAAANKKGSQIPKCQWLMISPRWVAIPEFCSILPKAPPAPVINNTEAALASALPTQPSVENIRCSSLAGSRNAKNTPTNSATKGSPTK